MLLFQLIKWLWHKLAKPCRTGGKIYTLGLLNMAVQHRNVIIQHLLPVSGLESNNSPANRILSLYITASIKSDQMKVCCFIFVKYN